MNDFEINYVTRWAPRTPGIKEQETCQKISCSGSYRANAKMPAQYETCVNESFGNTLFNSSAMK